MSKIVTSSTIVRINDLIPFVDEPKIDSVLTLPYTRSSCTTQSVGSAVQHMHKKVDQIFSRDTVRDLYTKVYNGDLSALYAVSKMYQYGILLPENVEMSRAFSGYSCLSRAYDVPSYVHCENVLKKDIKEILMEQISETVVSKKILLTSNLLSKALKHKEHPIVKLNKYVDYVSKKLGYNTDITISPSVKGVQVALVYVRTKDGYTLHNALSAKHSDMFVLNKLKKMDSIPKRLPVAYNETLSSLEGRDANSIIVTGVISVHRDNGSEYRHFYPEKNSIDKAVLHYMTSNRDSEVEQSLSTILTFVADSLFSYNSRNNETKYVNVDSPYVLTHLQSLGFRVAEIQNFFARLIPVTEVRNRNFIERISALRKTQNFAVNGFWLAPTKSVDLNSISRAKFIL